jgi:signal transduction histidine kinase
MKRRLEIWIQQNLTSPILLAEDEDTTLTQVLSTYVASLIILLLIALPLILFAFPQKLLSLMAWLAGMLTVVLSQVLIKCGYIRQVACLALIVFWTITTVLVYISGGMQSLDWAFYIPGVVAAGLFFESRGVVLYALASLVAGLIMVILDTHGYRLPRLFPFPPISGWTLLLFNISMTLLPLTIYLSRLRATLAVARQELGDRKRAQVEITRLNEELEWRVRERTAEFEAANRELEIYSYSASHDLRSPIRSVVGLSQIVLETYGEVLPPDAQDDLRQVIRSGRHMGRLVDDLLELLRVRRQPLSRRCLDMTALVQNAWDELRAKEDYGTCEVISMLLEPLPDCEADPELIRLLWLKILDNAIKFTRHHPDARIEVSSQLSPDGPIYCVRDNGVGFDMRYLDRLFGVFERLNRLEDYGGTGAGLAIAKRIVERHGGKIWAESLVGRGASFYFTLSECSTLE